MHHPLQQQVAAIRQRARRLLLLRGGATVLLVLAGSLLALGLLDYFLRPEAAAVRVIFTIALVGLIAFSIYRFLWRPLSVTLSNVQIAQYVQRRFPQVGDRLASAMEFLDQDEHDPLAGSAALRRTVVVEAITATNDLPLKETVDSRSAVRMLGFLIIALVVGVILVVVNPSGTALAVARLTNPFNEQQWPRRHVLEFVQAPTRLAAGDLFETELRDQRGEPPEDVVIEYRLPATEDQPERVIAEPMQYVDGTMVAHRDNVRQSFSYRARGGDDQSMPWIELQVVEAPRVETLTVNLTPPDYSGMPAEQSEGRITALAGSTVQMQGETSKPISTAVLHWPGSESSQSLQANVGADGRIFAIGDTGELQIEHSGNYWIELVDADGVTSVQEKWPIRAVSDEPPSVVVEQPETELFVTGDADVPLRIVARDQFALRSVGFKYLRSDQSDRGQQLITLYEGKDEPPKLDARQADEVLRSNSSLAEREIEHLWRLSKLQMPPGTQINFNAVASDYLPQEGTAPVQRINIITAAELEDRIARRQDFILGELARVLKLVVDARGRTTALEIQMEQVGRLDEEDVDRVQGLELLHRDIRRSLVSETEGVKHHLQALLAELESNKVDSPEITRRVRELDAALDRLEAGPLDETARRLTDAFKNAQIAARTRQEEGTQEPNEADELAAEAITAAGLSQDEIIAVLEEQLGDLERLNNYRQFTRELGEIQRDNQAIRKATEEQRGKTFGKDWSDLSPQQRADLEKLAQNQLDSARQLDKLAGRMIEAADALDASDPLAAASVRDAVDHARSQGISGQLRSSARGLQRNQVGQSLSDQQQAADQLEEMLDILSNRRENELDRLVAKLQEAETELQGLRERQAGLRKKFEEAKKIANEEERRRELQRLPRQQQQLRQEMERLGRQLKRLQANRAGDSLTKAGGKAGSAGQLGERGDAAGAADSARGAEKDLEEAQAELAQARRKAEQDLAAERLMRMQDTLRGLAERQQGLLQESQRLDALRNAQGVLTRGQLASVTDLVRSQQHLSDETELNADKLSSAKVFQFAIRRASAQMRSAVESLGRLETGVTVQVPQQLAIDQLEQVLAALTDDPQQDEEQPGGGNGPGGAGGQPGGDGIQAMAAIRLMKLMQQDINHRTTELRDKQAAGEPLSLHDAEQLQRLVADQGRLAEIAFELLTPPEQADPEFDPDNLPDLQPEDASQKEADDLLLPTDQQE